jgi:hypothetical protein
MPESIRLPKKLVMYTEESNAEKYSVKLFAKKHH